MTRRARNEAVRASLCRALENDDVVVRRQRTRIEAKRPAKRFLAFFIPDVAGGHAPPHFVEIDPFVLEKRRFLLRSERVLTNRSVAPYDAVTRDDERNGIVRKGRAHGSNGRRPSDSLRDPRVRADPARRNRARGFENVALK